jgi:hypothetical protein
VSDPLKERRWRCIKQNIAYLDPYHFIEDMFMGMRMAQFSDDLQYLLYLKKDKKGSFQAAVANYIKLPSRLSAG